MGTPDAGHLPVIQWIDRFYRSDHRKTLSQLTRLFGADHRTLVEDALQEALLSALKQWPGQGLPKTPLAWIVQAAKNRAIDSLRRRSYFKNKTGEITRALEAEPASPAFDGGMDDAELQTLFACCHPVLSREMRVALALRLLGGLEVPDIARAYLARETAIEQRLVRAKRKMRRSPAVFTPAENQGVADRLDSVLEVLYLLFNAGYAAYEGKVPVQGHLCGEAIRLAQLLAEAPGTIHPKTHALLALLLFQASRLRARVNAHREIVLLKDQDRTLWDKKMIAEATRQLGLSAQGETPSEYHLLAGIAACHATAVDDAATDWGKIKGLYDLLLTMSGSPIAALNRAVAVSRVEGPAAGVALLEALESQGELSEYYLLPAALADLYLKTGERPKAAQALTRALAFRLNDSVRKFLEKRLWECRETL